MAAVRWEMIQDVAQDITTFTDCPSARSLVYDFTLRGKVDQEIIREFLTNTVGSFIAVLYANSGKGGWTILHCDIVSRDNRFGRSRRIIFWRSPYPQN